jgi:hypothetical protein
VVADLLVRIEPTHIHFVEELGTSVVVLDKALYGCVEATALWHVSLCATMKSDGLVPNSYDPYVFIKQSPNCAQVTALMHVDDLFITKKI